MRGFVTIDRQSDSKSVAIWVSARVGRSSVDRELAVDDDERPSGTNVRPLNVNAVLVDLCEDPRAMDKVRSLTRSSVVVATTGSNLDGLPVVGEPLRTSDFDALLEETEIHQRRILDALGVYATRISAKSGKLLRPRSMALPEWPSRPHASHFQPCDDTAPHRALATANFVCAAWGYWLTTDEERRVRAKPSGRTPSRMTPDLRTPIVADLPPGFAASLHEQALV